MCGVRGRRAVVAHCWDVLGQRARAVVPRTYLVLCGSKQRNPRHVRRREPMGGTVRPDPGSRYVLVAPTGNLDLASADAIEGDFARALSQHSPYLVIDLEQVEFVDACGLTALVKARQMAEELGGEVVLL